EVVKPSLIKPSDESRGYLGELSTSDALTDQNVAGLINLASTSRHSGAQVVHVHGRADQPETIVATEGALPA
ncbi:MAG: hypothetical protein AAF788_00145, partial [Pseudomonadota bacterium]